MSKPGLGSRGLPLTPAQDCQRIYDELCVTEPFREACDSRYGVTHIEGPTVIADAHEPWYPPVEHDAFYWGSTPAIFARPAAG